MTVDILTRPLIAVQPAGPEHVHDRTCWWDVLECRWAGPAHPAPPTPRIPAPRRSPEE
ncbi:hypothetical protein [Actinomycetospora lemnae]|uniref:Uncharacterized protein n=1 Tax=Actinomycetospora lemnae TaxID=3019891 RepID=A0ABT5SYJ0_9PSEU|nr:hypothetical protein [Actinomycetospora sp. DW7H6]MDD7967854.1 hypothetical protein [Actinomycetospora sp. DW7H6]